MAGSGSAVVTVADLVERSGLSLSSLVPGPEVAIGWVHSSDLPDPTPFLAAGHLLLTTGQQFRDRDLDSFVDDYVHRLVDSGLAGLGIGTGVTWPTPPEALVEACGRRGLALVEIPYAIPFIAVSRWIVDALRARDAWSVTALRALSLAALSERRLSGVLYELARQLDGQVLLFDAQGELAGRHGSLGPADLDLEAVAKDARGLLRRNVRAGGSSLVPGAVVTLQTLGRRDHLRGVLATVTTRSADAAANTVITGAVALAELSMEDNARRDSQQDAIDAQLLRLLVEGRRAAAERILGPARPLPPEPYRVLVLPGTASVPRLPVPYLAAPLDGDKVIVLHDGDVPRVLSALPDVAAGVSRPCRAVSLGSGIAAARAALTRSTPDRRVVAEDDEPVVGLVARSEVTVLARARLRRLLDAPEAGDLLRTAETWLRHNTRYDPAARELGLHRHTVKAQLERVQDLVDLDLESFAGKAELWALLQSR